MQGVRLEVLPLPRPVPVGGGVEINPLMALAPEKILADKDSKVSEARDKVKIELAKGRWWWD